MRARRTTTKRRVLTAVLSVAAVLTAGGCTGVPTSSAPQTVGRVDLESGPSSPPITPAVDADPRGIVNGFLESNAIEPKNHSSAREFLSPAMQRNWNDQTVTIVNTADIGVYPVGPSTVSLTVSGAGVGSISAAGVFTPSTDRVNLPFTLRRLDGHWRIVSLRPGLLIDLAQFRAAYRPRPLYFFDTSGSYLIPDLRYSALAGADLDSWLVSQLAAGPRNELRNAVLPETTSAGAAARRATFVKGIAEVEVAGAAQLDATSKRQLAGQIAKTIDTASPDQRIQITDGGAPVRVPDLGGTTFSTSDFGDYDGPAPPDNDVYYLRAGRIVNQDGKQLSDPLNRGLYLLKSIAVSRQGPNATLTVAAETPAGLVVGTEDTGFGAPVLPGVASSRPAWAPGIPEVWISKGTKIYRITVSGKRATSVVPVSIASLTGGGAITSVRLSPEGSRIAIVIQAGAASRLFVGAIVRTAGQVRIDTLQSISPDNVRITDAAWIGDLKLFAVGSLVTDGAGATFETNADGSFFTSNPLGVLQHTPDSVTGANGQVAWVSVDNTVWVQDGRSWRLAGDTAAQTDGDKPVYLE